MRKGKVERNTKETKISCEVNLDGSGQSKISTRIGFFDHMLELLSHHSLIDIDLNVKEIPMLIFTIQLKILLTLLL